MFRNLVILLVLLGVMYTASGQNATTHMPMEHGEAENFAFVYEGNTHLMLMVNHGKCYIWQLSAAEKAHVHTDAGIKAIELRLLKQVNNAYFTKVPQAILHPQVKAQCTANGHRHVDFYLVH